MAPEASRRQWTAIVAGVGAGSLLLLATVCLGPRVGRPAAEDLAAGAARACSFAVCESAGCDAGHPYFCEGTTGCAAAPWGAACAGPSCSLADCASRAPAKGADSCDGAACPAARCASGAQQLCGDDQPYQCLAGSANLGCSADPYGWPAVADTTCAKCCDARTCAAAAALDVIGGERDDRGCLVAAGYSWCASLDACVRVWETGCPDA